MPGTPASDRLVSVACRISVANPWLRTNAENPNWEGDSFVRSARESSAIWKFPDTIPSSNPVNSRQLFSTRAPRSLMGTPGIISSAFSEPFLQ
jgi:hypothetical protein